MPATAATTSRSSTPRATAIVVAPDRHAARWQAAHGAETMPAPKPTLRTIVKMLRVHQWLKNSLIAVPMVLSHEYFNTDMIWQCLLAFVSFSAVASAIYILNDFFDLALDRKHPTKRNRPFASGALSIPFGLGAIAVLLAIGIGTGLFLSPEFLAVLGGYMVVTTAYSLSFKRMLLVDVLTLAGLYTIRVLAGAAATGVDVSFWLLAFSIFFFLSLALVKRFVELRTTAIPPASALPAAAIAPKTRRSSPRPAWLRPSPRRWCWRSTWTASRCASFIRTRG